MPGRGEAKTMNADETPLLTGLLEQVSRSFYLTLRLLPGGVRPQIGLAYLLARTSDTIADTELIEAKRRLEALEAFRQSIAGVRSSPPDLRPFLVGQGNPAERSLLNRAGESLAALASFAEADRRLVRNLLDMIISGQSLDLQRFADTSERRVKALADAAELDDYTYRVAGCVGEFWTDLCRIRLFPKANLDDAFLRRAGVDFGKGLQLVNILRDLPRDLRQGRCYLPADELAAAGLTAGELLHPGAERRVRPVYDRWLRRSREHLETGWAYLLALPRGHVRIRLACALPVLIGIKTLTKLQKNPVLLPDLAVKVSRTELRWILVRLLLWYPCPKTWRRLPSHAFFAAG